MHFFDADGLAGKDGAEIDFFVPQTDAAASGNDNDFVVEWIIDVGKSLVDARGRLLDLGRAFHVQRFVRTLVAPSSPFAQRFEIRIRPSSHSKSDQRSASISEARSAVAAQVSTRVK